eukprot:TRINITY_DN3009_c0_g2_i3.p1 TRINITY_DN3009_c0_g2~~TRINITY_DN3009_c0_g2_i3.p1  ORF type:complete len:155 (-),score=33.35 TRINITY_DN3009_c0_g2_i3:104-568(-)
MHPGYYLERHNFLSNTIVSGANLCVIPIVYCEGVPHLLSLLNEITRKQGEGIMLYHPAAKYTSGRTSNILKLKDSSEEDVRYIKNNSNSYSFLCEQKNGIQITVKCSGWDYSFPPEPGTVLTVKYNGLFSSSQKMKHPFLLRVRNDLNWNQMDI